MRYRANPLRIISITLLSTLLGLFVAETAIAGSGSGISSRKLFAGKVTLKLPKAAAAPKKINSKTYQVQPKSSERKFVIYVTRETLLKDEASKSNKQLASSIRAILEAQSYQVSRISTSGDVFTADFTTYTEVPWQRIGTSAARGTARFTRTRNKELIGTILLCDPRQWTDASTKDFKKVVTGAKVTK